MLGVEPPVHVGRQRLQTRHLGPQRPDLSSGLCAEPHVRTVRTACGDIAVPVV